MKKKILKIAAIFMAVVLIVGICVIANAFLGNPFYKMLVTKTAKEHLAENYADTDFFIDRVSYDFKTMCYYAHIKSPSSVDSHFTLYLELNGKLSRDSYEQEVLSGWNTARRIGTEYRKLTDSVFQSPAFPFEGDILFGDIEFAPRDYAEHEDIGDYALIQEELELDKLYDIEKMGAKAGHLTLYIDDKTVTVERAAEIMLKIRQLMEEGGAPFYAMDFTLRYPKNKDWQRPAEQIEVRQFLCSDIYEEGMVERVRVANEEMTAYYKKLDEEKNSENITG